MTDIEKAIKVLRDNYDRAMKLEYVMNKIAWALYKTWRYFDSRSDPFIRDMEILRSKSDAEVSE